MRSPLHRVRAWDAERQLSSSQRSGRYAREKARRRHRTFIRRTWHYLLGANLLLVATALPALLVSGPSVRYFLLGALTAGLLGLDVVVVLLLSGTAATLMGEVAEEWTSDELRKLTRKGWRVINGVQLRQVGDIDHVAVGPGGLVALETKWSGDPWDDSPYFAGRLERACAQAGSNARDVWNHVGRPTTPRGLVVLWSVALGSERPAPPSMRADVDVVLGNDLQSWAASLEPVLDPPQVDAIWRDLERHVRRRDAHDRSRSVAIPRSPAELFQQTWLFVIGVMLAVTAHAVLFTTTSNPLAWVALLVLEAAIGVCLRALTVSRPVGTGVVVGALVVALFILGVYAYAFVSVQLR